jgi:outer membrane lipoprotein-sorting protein
MRFHRMSMLVLSGLLAFAMPLAVQAATTVPATTTPGTTNFVAPNTSPPPAGTTTPSSTTPSNATTGTSSPGKPAAATTPAAAAPNAQAQTGVGAGLSPGDRAILERVENYLNSIRTLSARFVQITDDGRSREGEVYLSRPGKLRVQYDPPYPMLMIASGIYLSIYDPELKHTTFLPIESTPAWFLIQDRISLGKGITITKVEHGADTIRVTMHETGESARLTLVFSDQPLQLRKWTVVDSNGKPINVALSNAIFDTKLDPNLFKFVEPTSPGRELH